MMRPRTAPLLPAAPAWAVAMALALILLVTLPVRASKCLHRSPNGTLEKVKNMVLFLIVNFIVVFFYRDGVNLRTFFHLKNFLLPVKCLLAL
jgi:hypothetical protein